MDFSTLYLTLSWKAWNWFTAFLWPQPWCPPGERQYFRFIRVQHKISGQTAKGSLIIDRTGGQDWENYWRSYRTKGFPDHRCTFQNQEYKQQKVFQMWTNLATWLQNRHLCVSGLDPAGPRFVDGPLVDAIPELNANLLRFSRLRNIHQPQIIANQAMTSRAFWLRVGFGSGLTKKLGFRVRVRVLCILWS